MTQLSSEAAVPGTERSVHPALNVETRDRLGKALQAAYEGRCIAQPVPDAQIDLILRLRQKERELRRAG